jgi:hypothetical protein
MPKPFRGVVNVDIRDSVPDWEPFLQPKAPEGAPNVLMIGWDDVGYGAATTSSTTRRKCSLIWPATRSATRSSERRGPHRTDRRRNRDTHAA